MSVFATFSDEQTKYEHQVMYKRALDNLKQIFNGKVMHYFDQHNNKADDSSRLELRSALSMEFCFYLQSVSKQKKIEIAWLDSTLEISQTNETSQIYQLLFDGNDLRFGGISVDELARSLVLQAAK